MPNGSGIPTKPLSDSGDSSESDTTTSSADSQGSNAPWVHKILRHGPSVAPLKYSEGPTKVSAADKNTREGRAVRDGSLEDRIAHAPEQVEQIIRYTKLMEDRVQALDVKFKVLKGSRRPNDSSKTLSTSSTSETIQDSLDSLEPFRLIPDVRRFSDIYDYLRRHKSEKDKRYLIDVFNADATESARHQITPSQDGRTPNLGPDHLNGSVRPTFTEVSSLGEAQNQRTATATKRLRINSRRLMMELSMIFQLFMNVEGSQQFIAPFHLFAMNEQKLRGHVKDLEERCLPKVEAEDERRSAKMDTKDNRTQTTALDVAQSPISDTLTTEDDDESIDSEVGLGEFDEYGEPLLSLDILEVVESCQINRGRAVRMLKKHREPHIAIHEILKTMTAEEREIARVVEARACLEEWKVLLKVLDLDLKSFLDRYHNVHEGKLKTIAFSDLGFLFQPGDIVFSVQHRQLQALAVVTSTGGRELLTEDAYRYEDRRRRMRETPRKRANDDKFSLVPDKISQFVVDCFHYDFDGVGFGCVSKSIVIPKYVGVKEIQSLPVYPYVMQNVGDRDLKAELMTRGNRYLELCSDSEVCHRQYFGRTLDEVPEEVDSQVIVDAQTASLVQPNDRPGGKDWLPVLGLQAPNEPDKREVTDEETPAEYCRVRAARSAPTETIFLMIRIRILRTLKTISDSGLR